LRARPALTQSFPDRVLHQHRNELGHPRTLVPAGFTAHRIVNLARLDTVGKLSGQLVSHSIELLSEDVTAKFLAH